MSGYRSTLRKAAQRHRAAAAMGLVSMLLFLTGCPSGYRFKRVPGQVELQTRAVLGGLTRQAERNCPNGLEPYVHCEQTRSLCHTDPTDRSARLPRGGCGGLRPVVTFVHLSDAQLKEHQVTMEGPAGLDFYDSLASGARRHPELERYDFAAFLATILSINSLSAAGGSHAPAAYAPCPAPLPPSFVLHTGDAIDAGMYSELFEFLTIVGELDVPFYNAVGNHDNLFFGTFPKGLMEGTDVTIPFVPVGETDRFLLAHRAGAERIDFSIPFRPRTPHRATRDPEGERYHHDRPRPKHGSDYFGFDLYCHDSRPRRGGRSRAAAALASGEQAPPSFQKRPPNSLCSDSRGYYGQDIPVSSAGGRQRKVRLIVLNTAELGPKTKPEALRHASRGRMRDEQYLWLSKELSGHNEASTLFIVAGHHALASFTEAQKGWLEKYLLAEPRVVAYLSGHTHRSAIRRIERSEGAPLWEVTAGSTLVYPQLAHLVDVLERPGSGEAYLRIRSFRQRLSDASCGNECALGHLAARARSGAYHDQADSDFRLENVAKLSANGLLQIGGFR